MTLAAECLGASCRVDQGDGVLDRPFPLVNSNFFLQNRDLAIRNVARRTAVYNSTQTLEKVFFDRVVGVNRDLFNPFLKHT